MIVGNRRGVNKLGGLLAMYTQGKNKKQRQKRGLLPRESIDERVRINSKMERRGTAAVVVAERDSNLD